MRKAVILFLLSVSGVIYTACTVYKNVPMEVLRLKEVALPEDSVRGVAFIYRNFKLEFDTLQNYFDDNFRRKKDSENLGKNIDSLVAVSCLNSAADAFLKNGITGHCTVFPVHLMHRVTGDSLFVIPDEMVKKLALKADADYLISLETFTVYFSRYSVATRLRKARKVEMAGAWSVYRGDNGRRIDWKVMKDTFKWDPEDLSDPEMKRPYPPRLAALQLAAGVYGENYARRFYDEWIPSERLMIILPLKDFRSAAEFARNQEWEKAAETWVKYTGDRYHRKAAIARYNLSLSYEMRDSLNEACHWVSKAADLAGKTDYLPETDMIEEYQRTLTRRLGYIERSRNIIH